MTTDITELAQREKFEAWAEECNALPWGYLKKLRIYTGFYSDHTYTSLWAAWKAAGAELVEALEKAQQVDEELCKLLPPGAEYMDPPDGGDVTPLEGVRRMVADYRQRIAELEAQNEYIRKRYQQLDLLIGKNILAMQAAIIEWQATGDAKNGLAWIYNTLFGPGELPDEAEKDAQAYFDRKYAPLDEELMALHKWFWEQSEAERAAAGIKLEAE
ncbi:TPA: ead/Ea22-like family protein [Klebsiella pneumoniae]|uniref:ead/Ea22-like family protein n=1 Tax=Klebsiella pneumoniae TaxID=573 RepID=UPI001E3D7D3E|nr:ead/Ea22-like family protein [Klebsiella pneumoniae]